MGLSILLKYTPVELLSLQRKGLISGRGMSETQNAKAEVDLSASFLLSISQLSAVR